MTHKATCDLLKGNCDGVMAAGIDALLGGHVRNGSLADIRPKKLDVRFTPKSGHWLSVSRFCANSGHCTLFDHLGGASEQGWWHREAERFRSFKVDDEFKLRRLVAREWL